MSDWDELSPADDSIVSQYPANERDARSAAKTNFGIDHREENDANVGKHEIIKLLPQTTPDAVAGEGHLYTKDVGGGVIELFSQDAAGNETQLTADGVLKPFPTGTRVFFQQTTAPTGFTKETNSSFNNTAIRIVTGGVGSRTNTLAFSTVFSRTVTDFHALTLAQTPNRTGSFGSGDAGVFTNPTGPFSGSNASTQVPSRTASDSRFRTLTFNLGGGNEGHRHGMDMRVNYHDTIIAIQD